MSGLGRSLPGTFPFLFGGTFIEAFSVPGAHHVPRDGFPFLFGGTFIEAASEKMPGVARIHFPSFSEGLSLRQGAGE